MALVIGECNICKIKILVRSKLELCKKCLANRLYFRRHLYFLKSKIQNKGVEELQNTHKYFKYNINYIYRNLFKYKLQNTKLGVYYREIFYNYKETNNTKDKFL